MEARASVALCQKPWDMLRKDVDKATRASTSVNPPSHRITSLQHMYVEGPWQSNHPPWTLMDMSNIGTAWQLLQCLWHELATAVLLLTLVACMLSSHAAPQHRDQCSSGTIVVVGAH